MGLLDLPAYSRSQADGRFLTRANPVGLIPGPVIAGRSLMAMDVQADDGMFSRTKHTVQYSATNLRVVYGNHNIGVGDQFPSNSIAVKASLEIPVGTYFPLQFPGTDENGYVHIQPGCFVVSSPVPVNVVAGDIIFANQNVSPDGGGSYPVASTSSIADTNWEYRVPNTTTDYTAALPSSGLNTQGLLYAPNVITGYPTELPVGKRPPQVFCWGDSIMHGSGDATGAPSWGTYDLGWVRRGLNNQIPFVFAARSGTLAANFNTNIQRRATAALMTGCTHAIEAFGANDLGQTTWPATQNNRLLLWNLMSAQGIKVYATTTTPRTTSTDSWATLGNQTVNAVESNRVTLNDWIRDGAPLVAGSPVAAGTSVALRAGQPGHPLVGYIDTADACESSRNSGKWKVTGAANYPTVDGLHPSTAVHLLMAAKLPLSAFVAA